jgi:hypothetical protein
MTLEILGVISIESLGGRIGKNGEEWKRGLLQGGVAHLSFFEFLHSFIQLPSIEFIDPY